MGRVYLARSRGGRPVAIKVIRSEYAEDPHFRSRFRREVDAARTVGGLYTAPVLDADPDDEHPWLATAYIPGPSLQQVVADHGPLPESSARVLGAGIAEALGAIHAAGLIHRDLKPSNIICGPDGPRVIDFGISHAIDGTSLTATGMVVGSPRYASPEQCAATATVVPASDVFALGGVLVYAMTGSPPFGDGPDHVQLYLIVHEQPDLAAVPTDLRSIVGACLEKGPAQRPSIDELLDELLPEGLASEDWLPQPVRETLGAYSASALRTEAEAITHQREAHIEGAAADRPASGKPGDGTADIASRNVPSRRRILAGLIGLGALGTGGGWYFTSRKDSSHNASGVSRTASTLLASKWDVPVDLTANSAGAFLQGDFLIGVNQGPSDSNGNAPQNIIALRRDTGATAWSVSLPPSNPFPRLPATDGRAVYTCIHNTIYAYRIADGQQLWPPLAAGFTGKAADDNAQERPQVLGLFGNTLIVGSVSTSVSDLLCLAAFDSTTRRLLWTKRSSDLYQNAFQGMDPTDVTIWFAAPSPGNLVFASVSDGTSVRIIIALKAATGTELWRIPFTAHPQVEASNQVSAPVITTADDGLFVTNMTDGMVHAFDLSGKWRWDFPGNQGPSSSTSGVPAFLGGVAVSGNTVFVADTTSAHAIDTATGKPLWAKPFTMVSGLLTAPNTNGKELVIEANTPGSSAGQWTLTALDPATGTVKATKGVPPSTGFSDVLLTDSSTLYVVSATMRVMAFNLS